MSKCKTCGREKPKTNEQRAKFHAMCRDIGNHIGLSPGKVKESIKQDYFGLDEYKVGNKWYQAVKPSEQAERAEYSDLIDYTIIWAAENCDYVFGD
jgi:hypothetical protein